ncbi:hypothetical protein D9757_002268 [Collybiopsis confluens]|uniref:Uncharacterized protein n=1 Tax=Collybiopsis confluens TaxID=2823264 RepID=A0A8H5HZR0_9AGAR|nr:hypothetical protein D9757_002268 [Collybiopsis confluens]
MQFRVSTSFPKSVLSVLVYYSFCSLSLQMASVTTQTPKSNENPATSTKIDIPLPPQQEFDDNETVVGTDESPETEDKFRSAVENLRDAIEGYNTAIEQKADEKIIEKHEQNVVQSLRETAESSPNPKVKEYYKAKALEFMKVGRTAKKVLTNDIIKGVLFILASPVALLSSVVVSTGGLVYGLGSVVRGVGDLMSGMTFSGTVLGSKDKKHTTKNAGVQNGEEGEGKEEDSSGQPTDSTEEAEKNEAEVQGDQAAESGETEQINKAT